MKPEMGQSRPRTTEQLESSVRQEMDKGPASALLSSQEKRGDSKQWKYNPILAFFFFFFWTRFPPNSDALNKI